MKRGIETKSVTVEDFRDALERIKPSVTPDLENWYQGFRKRFKSERAPVAVTWTASGRIVRRLPLVTAQVISSQVLRSTHARQNY